MVLRKKSRLFLSFVLFLQSLPIEKVWNCEGLFSSSDRASSRFRMGFFWRRGNFPKNAPTFFLRHIQGFLINNSP